jgi:Amt family ammonium transporter
MVAGVVWALGITAIHVGAQPAEKDKPAAATTAASPTTPAESAPATQEDKTKQLLSDPKVIADTAWTLITAFLVFWMNAGFGCVEAGFCRAKNATNILAKNFVVFGISTLTFWAVGFAIMFGDGNLFAGHNGWFVVGPDNSPNTLEAYEGIFDSMNWTGIPLWAKFFFQLVFAGTAATIVSGCVAERIHYGAFMVFTILLVGLGYSVTGHWIWGGGWLGSHTPAFRDFAGSTVVHSVGGWAGLAGILLLGPRIGKYRADGTAQPIPGHSMALAFLGGLILWLGWFGFNPGSTMAANPAAISHIVVTTNLACAAGLVASTMTAWIVIGKPDFSMTVNGTLAGLVAITAPCAFVSAISSVIIGVAAGVLVVFSVLFFDRIRVDDPVGALSVHLTNGIWGTLSLGLFAEKQIAVDVAGIAEKDALSGLLISGSADQLASQLLGVVAVGAYAFVFSLVGWGIIKATIGMRVSPEAESIGLDLSEMGMEAYPAEPAVVGGAALGARRVIAAAEGLPASHESRPMREAAAGQRSRSAPPIVRYPSQQPGGPGSAAIAEGAPTRLQFVLENADPKELRERWRQFCSDERKAPQEFRDLFPKVIAFQGNIIQVRNGDPDEVCRKLQRLFQGYVGPELHVRLL